MAVVLQVGAGIASARVLLVGVGVLRDDWESSRMCE